MAEATSMRLAKAAATFNVSMDHVLQKLKESGFTLENKPTSKLTGEMVTTLEKAFGGDKAIKEQADNTKIDKAKKETVEMPEDSIATHKKKEEEKDVLVKTNLAHKEEEVISSD